MRIRFTSKVKNILAATAAAVVRCGGDGAASCVRAPHEDHTQLIAWPCAYTTQILYEDVARFALRSRVTDKARQMPLRKYLYKYWSCELL